MLFLLLYFNGWERWGNKGYFHRWGWVIYVSNRLCDAIQACKIKSCFQPCDLSNKFEISLNVSIINAILGWTMKQGKVHQELRYLGWK